MNKKKNLLLSASTYAVSVLLGLTAAPITANASKLLPPENPRSVAFIKKCISTTASLSQESKDFIKEVAERGIGFLKNEELTEEERRQEFRNMLKNNFDMNTIGRFALGRYWRSASPAQQEEYLGLFESMIVEIYSRRFGDYNGEKFEILSARELGKTDVIVSSRIVPKNNVPIALDWRVRQKKGRFVIIDVMVEGVSMALTQRSDFASVIQRGGGNIDVLLNHLRQ